MSYTAKTDSSEDNILSIGLTAPEGMKWDHYGNPEFIEDKLNVFYTVLAENIIKYL